MMFARVFCLFVIIVDLVSSENINIGERCNKEYNLEFNLIGFHCQDFSSVKLYYYVGVDIEEITFQTLSKESNVFIDANVDRVLILKGDISQCAQILSSGGTHLNVIINKHECKQVIVTPTSQHVDPTKPSSTTNSQPVTPPSTTTSKVPMETVTSTSVTMDPVPADKTPVTWIASFAVTAVDIIQLLSVVLLTIIGIVIKFYDQLRVLIDGQPQAQPPPQVPQAQLPPQVPQVQPPPQVPQAQLQPPQVPQAQLQPPPHVQPVRSKRKRNPPNRYGNWQV